MFFNVTLHNDQGGRRQYVTFLNCSNSSHSVVQERGTCQKDGILPSWACVRFWHFILGVYDIGGSRLCVCEILAFYLGSRLDKFCSSEGCIAFECRGIVDCF